MGTHVSLSLSHHSCLFFCLTLSRSSRMNGHPRASPQLVRMEGCSPNSWTAKDRCWPRYERLIMALTDKLLAETLDGAPWLLQSHYLLCCCTRSLCTDFKAKKQNTKAGICICLLHNQINLNLAAESHTYGSFSGGV